MEISKGTTYLSLFISLLLVDFFILFRFMSSEYLLIYALIILISALLMNVFSTAKNFVLILAIILSLGFTLVFLSETTLLSQAILIGEYLLIMGALLLMWLLFAEVKKSDEERKELRKKAKELEKYVGSSSLLTPSEFENRVKFISTGTQRRNEENYYVVFKHQEVSNATESLSYLLKKAIFKTVRSDYDLVTKLNDDSYLVFLQNTNETGCSKVIERLFKSLRSELNTIQLPIDYEVLNQEEGLAYFEKNKGKGLKI